MIHMKWKTVSVQLQKGSKTDLQEEDTSLFKLLVPRRPLSYKVPLYTRVHCIGVKICLNHLGVLKHRTNTAVLSGGKMQGSAQPE